MNMAILDVFKTKKEDGKKTEKEVSEGVKIAKEEKKIPADERKTSKRDFSQIAARILEAPHVTEKAINMGQDNKYVFKVSPRGNKSEVKKAVRELYGVNVVDVNIINIPRKKRRLGQNQGFKSGYKKAVVTLAEGEKIETGI